MESGEIREVLATIRADVGEIKTQTKLTNGRVTMLEKKNLMVITAVSVILALKFPELLAIIKLI